MFPGFELFGAISALMPLFFLGVVGLGIYFAIKGYQQAKRRNAAIVALAAANGWGYVAEDPSRVDFFRSTPFATGDNRRARNRVWGVSGGLPFEAFDYSYETHTTDSNGHRSTTTHHFQVTWIPLPAPLPTVRFTSDNALLRGLTHLGAKDLEVESHEFNQRWKVWCEDERVGHAILTPRMIERFLVPDLQHRPIVIEGSGLMSYTQGQSDLAELPGVVALLHELRGLIPPFVFEPRSDAPAGG